MNSVGDEPTDDPPWVRWAVFVGPLAAYVAVGEIFPRLMLGVTPGDMLLSQNGPGDAPEVVIWIVFCRLLAMLVVVLWAAPRLIDYFPVRVSRWSVLTGVIGAAIWIGLCRLHFEATLLSRLDLPADWFGHRDSINPWLLYPDTWQRTLFLTGRFALLVIAVPLAEELMLRGCLIRAIESDQWQRLPLNQISRFGLVAATLYGVVSHPNEWIAAAVWFSLVTVLMVRTNRFWDCVVAHAVTNALLGVYIIFSGDWRLW